MAHVPAPIDVRTLLEELLGRPVSVDVGVPWAALGAELGTIGVYVDDSLVIRSVVLCDLPFSAYAGTAIGLMPASAATEAISEKVLPDTVQENLYEVLNISASLQNVDGAPHIRLYQVHHIGGPTPPEVAALGAVLGQRLDLRVAVGGYGEGRFSVVGVG